MSGTQLNKNWHTTVYKYITIIYGVISTPPKLFHCNDDDAETRKTLMLH